MGATLPYGTVWIQRKNCDVPQSLFNQTYVTGIMRIAMITDSYYPTRDGVVTSITTTKKALEDMGNEVFIIAPDPGKDARIDGVIYIGSIKFRSYEGYFIPILPSKALREIDSLDVDIIHIHGIAVMALRGLLYSRLLKKPVVLTFHTMVGDVLDYYSPVSLDKGFIEKILWKYMRFVLKRMDSVIVPTPGIGRELIGKVGEIDVVTIPTGIDTGCFHPRIDYAELKKKLNICTKYVVAHVSRLSYEKNIDMVIHAMHNVDATLVIAGSGPCEEELKKQTVEEGLTEKVIFTGFLEKDELLQLYSMADAVVSASAFETQGLSILEAMACGTPVVCRDARAFHDIITDRKNGFLFTDPEQLPETINCAIHATEEVIDMELSTAMENSRENSARKLIELYTKIVEDYN